MAPGLLFTAFIGLLLAFAGVLRAVAFVWAILKRLLK
jgi:hypothetical protein